MGQTTSAMHHRRGINIHAQVVPAVVPVLADSMPIPPHDVARQLVAATLALDAPPLRHLQPSLGTRALLIGTDHPVGFHEPRALARRVEPGFDAAMPDAVAFGKTRRFLGRRAQAILEPA